MSTKYKKAEEKSPKVPFFIRFGFRPAWELVSRRVVNPACPIGIDWLYIRRTRRWGYISVMLLRAYAFINSFSTISVTSGRIKSILPL